MFRKNIATVGLCIFICAVLAGCSSGSNGFRSGSQQYAGTSPLACPAYSTRFCDTRQGNSCRCINRRALQNFKDSFR